jgi:hypothetical protein
VTSTVVSGYWDKYVVPVYCALDIDFSVVPCCSCDCIYGCCTAPQWVPFHCIVLHHVPYYICLASIANEYGCRRLSVWSIQASVLIGDTYYIPLSGKTDYIIIHALPWVPDSRREEGSVGLDRKPHAANACTVWPESVPFISLSIFGIPRGMSIENLFSVLLVSFRNFRCPSVPYLINSQSVHHTASNSVIHTIKHKVCRLQH